MLETELDLELGSGGRVRLVGLSCGNLLSFLLPLSDGKRSVVVQKLEQGGCLVLSKSLCKLVDDGRNLETLVQNSGLSL